MIGSQGTAIDWAMRSSVGEAVAEKTASRALLDRLSMVLFAAIFVGVAVYTWLRPDYNWDMVAYIATALEDRISDPVELHRQTWQQIEAAGAGEGELYNLQAGNPYNLHQYQNPVDFESQLSMYRVKVAYIGLLRLLEPWFGLVNASILLSVLPSLGVAALALYWLWREGAVQGAIFLAPAMIAADHYHMTTAVVPDMLLAVVSLTAIYLLMRGRDALACTLLFVSVFVRPDNIILIFALLIAAVLFGWRKLPLTVTFVASLAACVLISKYGGHPGWWAHFYFSCVQIQNSMADFHPPFNLADFARGYVRGAVVSMMDNEWPMLLLALLGAWGLLYRAGRTGTGRENALMFALAIGMLGKFASFPLPDDRFYYIFTAGMAILVVAMWKPRFDLGKAARA